MKTRNLLLIIVVWLSVSTEAENRTLKGRNLVDDSMFLSGTEWHYHETELFSDRSAIWTCSFQDSLVGNVTYQYIKDVLLRTDGAKVWCIVDSMGQTMERLLYDFDLQIGDSIRTIFVHDDFPESPHPYAIVTNVDTISLSDGRSARKIRYDIRPDDIEFVGSIDGILSPANLPIPLNGIKREFVCCTRGDDLIYETEPNECSKLLSRDPAKATTWYGFQYFHEYPQEEQTPVITNITYTLGADTLINSKKYRQIRYTHENEHITNAFRGGIRQSEDRQQVYFIPWGSQTEYLLYNFNVKQGDTVYAYTGFNDISCVEMLKDDPEKTITPAWIVKDVQTIDGRKHILVQNEGVVCEWIEGIGTRHILWSQGRTCYATGMELQFQHALCAVDNEGNILYSFDTDDIGVHNNNCQWESMDIDIISTDTPSASKILRDGHLFILRDGKTFSITGQRVE